VAHTGGREVHIAFWLGKLKEGDHLEDLGTDGKIIKILAFKKYYRKILP